MIGPLGRLWAAATLGQHCPQMTQRRCMESDFDPQNCNLMNLMIKLPLQQGTNTDLSTRLVSYLGRLRCSSLCGGDLQLLPRPLEPRQPRGLDEEPLLVHHDLHRQEQPRHGRSLDGLKLGL